MREIKCRKHSHIHQVDFCPMCVHANLEAIHKLNRELNKKRSMSDYLTLIYLLFCVCVGGFPVFLYLGCSVLNSRAFGTIGLDASGMILILDMGYPLKG